MPDPTILEPSDAIVRITRAAICGSDLWFYRGVSEPGEGSHTGHEFVGVVEEVGPEVQTVRVGDAVIAPFAWCDGTCEYCRAGLQTSCVHGGFFGGEAQNGGQAEFVRVPFADGTLVKMPEAISNDGRLLDSSVSLCDVMGTGHFGVVAAETQPGSTAVIVGDGAVGLCGVLSAAKIIGAERVIAVGHNTERLDIAKHFGATHTLNRTTKTCSNRSSTLPTVERPTWSRPSVIKRVWTLPSTSPDPGELSVSSACRTTLRTFPSRRCSIIT